MFIMIHAYLDESGQQDNDYVVIAGHIGYTSQWSRFVDCWNGALGEQRKRLHMNSLRWSNHSTERLLKRLGPIPVECGLKRLIGGVRVSDYEDLVVGPKAKAAMKGYACSVLSVGVSLLLCDVPDGERFELVFEQQHPVCVRTYGLCAARQRLIPENAYPAPTPQTEPCWNLAGPRQGLNHEKRP